MGIKKFLGVLFVGCFLSSCVDIEFTTYFHIAYMCNLHLSEIQVKYYTKNIFQNINMNLVVKNNKCIYSGVVFEIFRQRGEIFWQTILPSMRLLYGKTYTTKQRTLGVMSSNKL